MIIIISSLYENVVYEVAEWLLFYKREFVIYDSKSLINLSYKISDFGYDLMINNIPISKFDIFWYRNGALSEYYFVKNERNNLDNYVNKFLKNEWSVFTGSSQKLGDLSLSINLSYSKKKEIYIPNTSRSCP